MRKLTKDELETGKGEGRPAALEDLKDYSGLRTGDQAAMYHAGTKKWYDVRVNRQVTEQEAMGYQCDVVEDEPQHLELSGPVSQLSEDALG
jgi:hypothetical protein